MFDEIGNIVDSLVKEKEIDIETLKKLDLEEFISINIISKIDGCKSNCSCRNCTSSAGILPCGFDTKYFILNECDFEDKVDFIITTKYETTVHFIGGKEIDFADIESTYDVGFGNTLEDAVKYYLGIH